MKHFDGFSQYKDCKQNKIWFEWKSCSNDLKWSNKLNAKLRQNKYIVVLLSTSLSYYIVVQGVGHRTRQGSTTVQLTYARINSKTQTKQSLLGLIASSHSCWAQTQISLFSLPSGLVSTRITTKGRLRDQSDQSLYSLLRASLTHFDESLEWDAPYLWMSSQFNSNKTVTYFAFISLNTRNTIFTETLFSQYFCEP